MKILALESSTTSAKAMLYDTERKEPRVFTKSYGTMFLNTVVQDMEKVYDGMLRAGRSVLEQEKDIDMISLGGAWHSAGLCGADFPGIIREQPVCAAGCAAGMGIQRIIITGPDAWSMRFIRFLN